MDQNIGQKPTGYIRKDGEEESVTTGRVVVDVDRREYDWYVTRQPDHSDHVDKVMTWCSLAVCRHWWVNLDVD